MSSSIFYLNRIAPWRVFARHVDACFRDCCKAVYRICDKLNLNRMIFSAMGLDALGKSFIFAEGFAGSGKSLRVVGKSVTV